MFLAAPAEGERRLMPDRLIRIAQVRQVPSCRGLFHLSRVFPLVTRSCASAASRFPVGSYLGSADLVAAGAPLPSTLRSSRAGLREPVRGCGRQAPPVRCCAPRGSERRPPSGAPLDNQDELARRPLARRRATGPADRRSPARASPRARLRAARSTIDPRPNRMRAASAPSSASAAVSRTFPATGACSTQTPRPG